jgi:hypothetical protein
MLLLHDGRGVVGVERSQLCDVNQPVRLCITPTIMISTE